MHGSGQRSKRIETVADRMALILGAGVILISVLNSINSILIKTEHFFNRVEEWYYLRYFLSRKQALALLLRTI